MFYICEEHGNKFGIKDTSDGVVEYYTSEQILNIAKSVTILGANKKKGICSVRHIDEYQELTWGRCKIISFVNTDKNNITIAVEKTSENKVYSMCCYKCYLDSHMTSSSTHKNGDLQWIFDEGRENKCAGVAVWLDYCDSNGNKDQKCIEVYIELHPDNTIELVESKYWCFDESDIEYVYNKERDCIDINGEM